MSRLALFIFVLLLAGCNLAAVPQPTPTSSQAQADLTCSQLVASALQAVGPACDGAGRNQACYGNNQVEAQFQQGIQAAFDKSGDLAQLQGLRLISTSPLDENAQTWGIAMLKAQADLPEALPGQNVTFLFYGGATLDNVSPNMESVVLSTGFGSASCASAPPSAILIQSPDGTQATMNINGANVTLGSTLHLNAVRNDLLTIATINGLAVVEAFGTTRNVPPGGQVTLPLNDLQVSGPPSDVQPFDLALISRAPFNLLDNPVQIPAPIAPAAGTTPTLPGLPVTSTLPPVTIPLAPTAIPTACVARADWTGTYIIQGGDTLFGIAQQFGITLAELQSGNCIADANIISAGQALRVPAIPPTITPTVASQPGTDLDTITTGATSTPTAANFRADESPILLGACTTIRWDVDNIDSVFFEGDGTTGHGQQEVCPKQTTRYTLLVIHPNGDQIPYFVTVEVQEPVA
jgi:hypothetical protein